MKPDFEAALDKALEREGKLKAELEESKALVSQWIDNHAKVNVKYVRAKAELAKHRRIPEEPDVNLKIAVTEFSRITHLFKIKNPAKNQSAIMKRRLNNLLWHLQALKND